ncbi:hypothetical protein C9374_001670 [Naegleria lovaniensis]|uniref:Uncharacterized protein n=1 Tax=Naegleria lovaniensis TaxID=51637 RepID=A0AA88KM70_NAELO|nr:uncharacterized protein C9374_001670 [Naegleria lovaniensis]KAG2387338.1 hypothetical protein C9374_001670 [Naegleria lovaniensis]
MSNLLVPPILLHDDNDHSELPDDHQYEEADKNGTMEESSDRRQASSLSSYHHQLASLIPPFARDIRLILNKFVELNTASLREFKTLWMSLKFSYIHGGKPDEVNYDTYIQEVYTTCIGYLMFSQEKSSNQTNNADHNNEGASSIDLSVNFRCRVGVIYLLYYLYCTQPKRKIGAFQQKRVQIKISIEAFQEMLKLLEEFIKRDLTEPFIVWHRLKSLSAFEYCAMVYVDPLMSSLRNPFDNVEEEMLSDERAKIAKTNHAPNIDYQAVKTIDDSYQSVKSDIISATERARDNITHQYNPVVGTISVKHALSLTKPNFVDELNNATAEIKLTPEQKITQFLDKYENDPAGTSLIKKKRRKKRVVKKKEEEQIRPRPSMKKTPSKASLEVSRSVNDFITSNINDDIEEGGKKKKKSKDSTEEGKKKRKKTKEESNHDETSEEPKKKKKKERNKEEATNQDEEEEKKQKKTKKTKKKSKKTEEEQDNNDDHKEEKPKKKKDKKKEAPEKKKKKSKSKDEENNGDSSSKKEESAEPEKPAPRRSTRVIKKKKYDSDTE